MRIALIGAPLLYFLISSVVYGSEGEYICKIEHVYGVSNVGSLEKTWNGLFDGDEFIVDRASGAIRGDTLTTVLAKSTRVIEKGSTANAFKSIADFGNQLQLTEVLEYREGIDKPFVAASMGGAGIVTGLCKSRNN